MVRGRTSLPIVTALGSQARLRIVSILADDPEKEWPVADLCNVANVSTSAFHEHRDALEDWKFMEKLDFADAGRRGPLYRLADSENAERVAELATTLNSHVEAAGAVEERQNFFG